MSDRNREADRFPIGTPHQSIDQWAKHGVQELTARAAEERAELGEPAEESSDG